VATKRQLGEVLGAFARTMVTEFPIEAFLDQVQRIFDILPITALGVTLISEVPVPQSVAALDAPFVKVGTTCPIGSLGAHSCY
jgi:hypothetical protein